MKYILGILTLLVVIGLSGCEVDATQKSMDLIIEESTERTKTENEQKLYSLFNSLESYSEARTYERIEDISLELLVITNHLYIKEVVTSDSLFDDATELMYAYDEYGDEELYNELVIKIAAIKNLYGEGNYEDAYDDLLTVYAISMEME